MLHAVRFLTVVPLRPTPGADDLGRSLAYFPLVGACLGLALAVVDVATQPVLSQPVRSAVLLGLLAAMTGALHLDGLVDSFDGLFGGHDPQRRLEIMRDSAIGSFGAVAGILVLLVQYVCLVELAGWMRLGGLLAMAALGRWAMVYATVGFPYARPEGLGVAFKGGAGRQQLVAATLFAAVVLIAALGPGGVALLGVAWIGAWLMALYCLTRVPGLTGDLYGAINELAAALVLLALLAAQGQGVWLGW